MKVIIELDTAAELGPLVRLVASLLGNGSGPESEPPAGLGQPPKPASK